MDELSRNVFHDSNLYFMNTLKLGGLTDNLDELQFS